MNKLKLALLVAGSLVAGASTSVFADEGQGTVTFNGELINETCQITSPLDQTVQLDKVSVKTLTKDGDEAGFKPFNINVECPVPFSTDPNGAKNIAVHLEPVGKTTAWDPETGNLKNNLVGPDDAKNVQIKIYNTNNDQRSHNKIGETGEWVEIKDTGKINFTYVGGYYATAQTTAGKVNATVMYTLVYK